VVASPPSGRNEEINLEKRKHERPDGDRKSDSSRTASSPDVTFRVEVQVWISDEEGYSQESVGNGFDLVFAHAAAAFIESLGRSVPDGIAAEYARQVRFEGPMLAAKARAALLEEANS
jgi:hypothetical protein